MSNTPSAIDRAEDDEYCPFDILNDPTMVGLRSHWFASAFGRQHVVTSEVRQGASVRVYLHGIGGSWASWTPLIQQQRLNGVSRIDSMILDLPGFGQSANTRNTLDIALVGDMVMEMTRSFGWTRIELVGHSMGGFLALDLASRGFDEVTKVSVVSGAYASVIATLQRNRHVIARNPMAALSYWAMSGLARLGPLGRLAMLAVNRVGMMPLFMRNVAYQPRKLRRSLFAAIVNGTRPRSFRLAVQAARSYDPKNNWSRIEVPVHAFFGRYDRLVPSTEQAFLQSCIPQAHVTVIERAGHFAHIETPQIVQRYLDH